MTDRKPKRTASAAMWAVMLANERGRPDIKSVIHGCVGHSMKSAILAFMENKNGDWKSWEHPDGCYTVARVDISLRRKP